MGGGRDDGLGSTALALLGAATVAVLALYHLTAYPTTWFDEGAHLLVPKNLVRSGEYRGYAGPTMSVGPTVMLPIAAAFRLFGVGLLPARLVMAAYLLVAVYAFHQLARRLGGPRLAVVATALLVSSPGVSLLEYGRQVLGEVPALAFLAAGLSVWFEDWERAARGRLVTAGVLLGLAVVTKPQLGISLAPALGISWLANLRRTPQRVFLVPGLAAAACCAAWGAFLLLGLRSIQPGELADMTHVVGNNAFLVFSPECMQRALKTTVGPVMYLGLLTPALAYAAVCAFRRGREERQWGVLTAIVFTNLVWYVVASIGWPRYAFFGASLGALWVARLFADCTEKFRVFASPAAPGWGAAVRSVLLLVLAAAIAVPMGRRVRDVIDPPFDAPRRMAAYLDAHVPRDALIETWEPEMVFLTDHRYHLPPPRLQAAVVRHCWLGGPPLYEKYDPLAANADFVLVGDYGHLSDAYPIERLARGYETVTWIARYHLLRRVDPVAEPGRGDEPQERKVEATDENG